MNSRPRGCRKQKNFSILSFPEKDRLAYARYQDALRYQASLIELNYGLGCLEGREEGRVEGLERGIVQGIEKVARNMKLAGIAVDVIIRTTGLSKQEIEKI